MVITKKIRYIFVFIAIFCGGIWLTMLEMKKVRLHYEKPWGLAIPVSGLKKEILITLSPGKYKLYYSTEPFLFQGTFCENDFTEIYQGDTLILRSEGNSFEFSVPGEERCNITIRLPIFPTTIRPFYLNLIL